MGILEFMIFENPPPKKISPITIVMTSVLAFFVTLLLYGNFVKNTTTFLSVLSALIEKAFEYFPISIIALVACYVFIVVLGVIFNRFSNNNLVNIIEIVTGFICAAAFFIQFVWLDLCTIKLLAEHLLLMINQPSLWTFFVILGSIFLNIFFLMVTFGAFRSVYDIFNR